jgi:hypothetical protein
MTEVTLIKHFPLADYAVVNRGTEYQPFVACWGFRPSPENQLCREGDLVTAYWAQGHYFDTEADALKYAVDREREALLERIAEINRRLDRINAKLDQKATR